MSRSRVLLISGLLVSAAAILFWQKRPETSQRAADLSETSGARIGAPPSVAPAAVLKTMESSRIQAVRRQSAEILKNPSQASTQEFLIALQELERKEPVRALKLLSERVSAAPRDENRIYLLGFPNRFQGKNAARKFSVWALQQKALQLEPEELQLLSEMYFAKPGPTEAMLQDWVPILDAHDSENRRYLMAGLMEQVSDSKDRERLGRNLAKRYDVRTDELLARPALKDSKIQVGR